MKLGAFSYITDKKVKLFHRFIKDHFYIYAIYNNKLIIFLISTRII